MTWMEFLRYERLEKLPHLDVLGSGRVHGSLPFTLNPSQSI